MRVYRCGEKFDARIVRLYKGGGGELCFCDVIGTLARDIVHMTRRNLLELSIIVYTSFDYNYFYIIQRKSLSAKNRETLSSRTKIANYLTHETVSVNVLLYI